MTDHLPECDRNLGSLVCICKQLRACEQRVREGSDRVWDAGWERGRSAGLSAARNAVAAEAQARHVDGPTMFITLSQALAAIDALKGES